MGIGVSVFLIAVGAVLAFAVNVQAAGIDLDTVGFILMAAGVIGLLATLFLFNGGGFGGGGVRRTTIVEDDVVEPAPRRRVVRRRTDY
ncbi:MAG: hypothetical protein QOJ69_1230 [Actinomycetota bacterium]|nr:hypothetical protein [Actinomycetota bacterium]